jgi:hypothetical protein
MVKEYKSIFVPETTIDLPNFLTEILIKNYLAMIKKQPPNCPFWRKEVCQNDEFLMELSKRYVIELTNMKNLLKCFNADVIAKYYTDSKRTGFKMLKKENQMDVLYQLFLLQSKEKEKIQYDFSDAPKLEKFEPKVYNSGGKGKMSL